VTTGLRPRAITWPRSLIAALPAWFLARALLLATFALARQRHQAPTLQIWDAGWYRDLGVHGYGPYGATGSRFFPLLPAIVRIGHAMGLFAPAWLLAVCWVAALLFAAALHRLTLLETGDEAAAVRAAWLIQLVPGANVLGVGYAEAVAGLLAVLYFLALRHRGDTAAGFAVGVLGGLVRPTGPLLAVAGVAQAVRSRLSGTTDDAPVRARHRRDRAGDRARRWLGSGWRHATILALAPLVGTAGYLLWARARFGDALTPYRVQAADDLRGGLVRAPWRYLTHDSLGGYPWPLVLVLLAVTAVALVLCATRLPVAYIAWSLPMVGLAVTAWGLHSLPRYVAAVFPLWMVVAVVCRNRFVWPAVVAVSAAGFAWVAYVNFVPGGPVP
jgi:hypothetical protein